LIWIVILVAPVAIIAILFLVLIVFVSKKLDPFRRRLLPFTVSQPARYAPPAWQYGAQPAQAAPAPHPEDQPKA
jgi:flagellar basal body-associated protein FliL